MEELVVDVFEDCDCELDIEESDMNNGGEFDRGKPRKLDAGVPSAFVTDAPNALGDGANDFALYVAALGEGGSKSDMPSVCSVVREGIWVVYYETHGA